MASKLKGGKTKVGNQKHKARVHAVAKQQKHYDDKFLEPQVVNEDRLERDRLAANLAPEGYLERTRDNAHLYRYPISAHHVGRWLRPDPRDTDMQIRGSLVKPELGAGGTPYGMMTVNDDVIGYFKDKKEQEMYLKDLSLAEYLIDGKRPETQEDTYNMFPELRDVPDEWFQTTIALQEALRTLLRDGKIRGREDHALVAKIVRDDFLLPFMPAWDPTGVILGKLDSFKEVMGKGYRRGIFNPRQWGMEASVNMEDQRRAKRLILRRLYPGLMESSDEEINAIIKNMSPVYPGSAVQQNPFTMGASVMDTMRPQGGETYVGSGVFPSSQMGQGFVPLGDASARGAVRGF